MNNLSFSSDFNGKPRKGTTLHENGIVDPDVLKSLISSFKKDYIKVLKSATELNNYYCKKEIYDALVLIECVEKSVDAI